MNYDLRVPMSPELDHKVDSVKRITAILGRHPGHRLNEKLRAEQVLIACWLAGYLTQSMNELKESNAKEEQRV